MKVKLFDLYLGFTGDDTVVVIEKDRLIITQHRHYHCDGDIRYYTCYCTILFK
jgi:hypothetical protein